MNVAIRQPGSTIARLRSMSPSVILEYEKKAVGRLLAFNPETIQDVPYKIRMIEGVQTFWELYEQDKTGSIAGSSWALDYIPTRKSVERWKVLNDDYSRDPTDFFGIDTVVSLLELPPTAKVLQIACNWGLYLHYLKMERGMSNIIGVDRNQCAVKYAQEFGIPVIEADVRDFLEKEPQESYDLVISDHFLCSFYLHGSQPIVDISRKIHRVLKPGGVLISDIESPDIIAEVLPNRFNFKSYDKYDFVTLSVFEKD